MKYQGQFGSNVHLDTSDLINKVGGLQNYGKILKPALNKSKGKMKTGLSKSIREIYNVKTGEVNPNISVKYTTMPLNIIATIKGRRFSLSRFIQGSFSKAYGRAFKVKVYKKRAVSPGGKAFLEVMPNGVFHVVKRTGIFNSPKKGRYAGASFKREKLEVLRTISVAQMSTNKDVGPKVLEKLGAEVMEQIESQHNRFFGKGGK